MQTFKIQGQEVVDTGEVWRIHIKKPIYGHCVAINAAVLMKAHALKRRIIVSCPGAEEETTPQEWMWKGQKIQKVFRIPDQPMTLWQAHIGGSKPEERQPRQGDQLPLV